MHIQKIWILIKIELCKIIHCYLNEESVHTSIIDSEKVNASSCTPSKAPAGLREVFCPELVIFPKTGVQIGNTGGFLLPSTSGRGGHKKRWPVSEPLQLFRESLPLPCFPCASFLFKSDLYSPSIAGSASKAAPLPSLAVAFSSCSPVRRRAFGVFRT